MQYINSSLGIPVKAYFDDMKYLNVDGRRGDVSSWYPISDNCEDLEKTIAKANKDLHTNSLKIDNPKTKRGEKRVLSDYNELIRNQLIGLNNKYKQILGEHKDCASKKKAEAEAAAAAAAAEKAANTSATQTTRTTTASTSIGQAQGQAGSGGSVTGPIANVVKGDVKVGGTQVKKSYLLIGGLAVGVLGFLYFKNR